MGIDCQDVWRDISDYIDDELDPKQRAALEEHVGKCRQCAAVLEGTCNVIRLYRDERVLAPPRGFQERLHQRLKEETKESNRPSRRAVLAWALSAAAAVPLGFALFAAKRRVPPQPEHQSPAGSPDSPAAAGLVAISENAADKVFHIPSCPYLHGKPKFLPVEEAIREGYSPCPVCIGKRKPEKKG